MDESCYRMLYFSWVWARNLIGWFNALPPLPNNSQCKRVAFIGNTLATIIISILLSSENNAATKCFDHHSSITKMEILTTRVLCFLTINFLPPAEDRFPSQENPPQCLVDNKFWDYVHYTQCLRSKSQVWSLVAASCQDFMTLQS